MAKTLYIIRGAQGSGKSTLAAIIKNGAGQAKTPRHREADQFWYMLGDGEYAFDPALLGKAHKWCQRRVERDMLDRTNTIIVSNTFTTKKECDPYYELAEKYGYEVQEIICRGQWENEHGVPADLVKAKRDNIELW